MIAFGLSMDAFAVSTTNGMCVSRQQTNRFFGKALSWSAMFGLFQGLMPLLGYFLGRAFSEFISSIDHWVAFVLLAFIGGKMVWEAVHPEEDEDACDTSLSFAAILTQAVATSIDALAGSALRFCRWRSSPPARSSPSPPCCARWSAPFWARGSARCSKARRRFSAASSWC